MLYLLLQLWLLNIYSYDFRGICLNSMSSDFMFYVLELGKLLYKSNIYITNHIKCT